MVSIELVFFSENHLMIDFSMQIVNLPPSAAAATK